MGVVAGYIPLDALKDCVELLDWLGRKDNFVQI